MKTTLRLHRETLAHLGSAELARAHGGYLTQHNCPPQDDLGTSGDPQPLSSGPSWCGC